MSDADRHLVEVITEQVIKLLRDGGSVVTSQPASSSAGPSAGVAHAAPIQPPIGVCTGDYSKFPELAGRLYGSASPASRHAAGEAARASAPAKNPAPDGGGNVGDPWPAPTAPHAPRALKVAPITSARPQPPVGDPWPAVRPAHAQLEPLPLTGIITATQLQDAMKSAADGVVWLGPDARLTPLANDLARSKKDAVRRGSPPASSAPAPGPHSAAGTLPWLWWIDGGCPVVRDVTQSFGLAVRPLAAGPNSSSLPQVIRELARAVKAKQTLGGILFVPTAARAVCLANRCPSLRAIVGTCGEAIEQGIRDVGANVLIIEYPHHGHRAVAAMLQRFMQQPPSVPPNVERDLVDMQKCS